MRTNIFKAALVAALFVFANANAQTQYDTFDMHKAMSNRELRALVNEKPWMLQVYESSKGRDIDLATIVLTDDKYRGEEVVSSDTTIFWKMRPYTGVRFIASVGLATDFASGESPTSIGADVQIGLGWANRKIGADVMLGYSRIGQNGGVGYYTMSAKPFYTVWRGGSYDQHRLDIGGDFGVIQAKSKAYDVYQSADGTIWGDAGGSTTAPRFMYGAFVRYEWRQFMGPHRLGVELAAVTYTANSSYSYYFDNVSTGEVLVDRAASTNTRHFNIQLKLVWSLGFGKSKNNYK